MTAYSPSAQVARAYLSRPYNDIDVYVEDVTCQNMYVRLVNRVLSGVAKVSTVFPLGGRDAVLKQCRASQGSSLRPQLFLIDGDFDLMLGQPTPALDRLHRISAYCIENLLVSQEGAVQVALEASPSAPEEELRLRIAWDVRVDNAKRILLPLFTAYAVAARLDVAVETASYSAIRLCRVPSDPDTLCPRLVRARIRQVVSAVRRKHSRRQLLETQTQIRKNISSWGSDSALLISGKTHWLPLLLQLLRKVAGLNESVPNLRVRLAAHYDTNLDPEFARALRSSAP